MRVLFLTHRLPYAPNRGDRVRAFHMLRALRTWAEVDLVSLVHDAEEASHVEDVRAMASTVHVAPIGRLRNMCRTAAALPTRRPLTHTLLNSDALKRVLRDILAERRPDVVLAYCSGMARFAIEPPLEGMPFVMDMVDVDSAKWAALSRTVRAPRSWIYRREAVALARFEEFAAMRARVTLVTTPHEREALAAIAPAARIEIVPNGVDTAALAPLRPPSREPVVVFCGVMNYPPNAEAATFLVRDIWPIVRRGYPGARLEIVGADPTPAVARMATADGSVTVTGRVLDVRPHLWGAAVAAAPLVTARGVQNKVLEAVAAGLPAVVTSTVMRGLPAELRPACTVADQAATFADAILELLALAPAARRARARAANLAPLAWEERLAPIRSLIISAAISRPRDATPV